MFAHCVIFSSMNDRFINSLEVVTHGVCGISRSSSFSASCF